MTKKKLTKQYLDEVIQKANCQLIGTYDDTINKFTKINFLCACGELTIKSLLSISQIGPICKKCTYKNMLEKTKKTNIEKFGCEDPNQLSSIKEKVKKTFIEKYGVDSAMKTIETKNKLKGVILEKYGVENQFQNKDVKNKIKETMLEKYGVEYPLQNIGIYDKFEETLMKNYGVKIPYHNSELKDKGRIKCLEKYGVEYTFQSSEIREKGKITCLAKYGVKNANQSIEVREKQQKNALRKKEFIMPSGTKYLVQGYEPFAIRDLLQIYDESQIKISIKDIPRILYKSGEKDHYYFPDIFIPHENKIIEVKSMWTIKSKGDNIEIKKNACLSENYKYEIWVYDAKGQRVTV